MITLNNINSQYLNSLNYELIFEKGLGTDNLNDKYFKLLNSYKSFFEQYVKEILPLELIDKNMKGSDLNFDKIKDEDKDFYQSTSTMNFSYIYLRNNFYVEKLSLEDIEFLMSKNEFDNDVREFIKRTYKNIINPYEEEKTVFYGPENQGYMCNSTDVVIGIRYDEFEQGTLSDSEFEERFFNQKRLVKQLSTVLEIAGPSQFNMNIRCIHYNEFSVVKDNSKQV